MKAPHDAIGGFGLFARFASLPVWRAWDVFGPANGTADERDLVARLARLARTAGHERLADGLNRVVGCIAVTDTVFFAPDQWVKVPADWSRNIVTGRTYELTHGEGQRLWAECLDRAAQDRAAREWVLDALAGQRAGRPVAIAPRLGQSSFRLAVLDAYGHQCAVTTEHSLPVIEAAHVRPWAAGGAHELPNGVPLRRDLHRLFDLGYVTIRPDLRLAVSPRLRDEFANGRVYYELHNRLIHLPVNPADQPRRELLAWHEAEIFRAH